MRILGISAFYHDSAACLVQDGEIVAAAQEERFTRKKHDSSFPIHAIRACLKIGGLRPDQLDYVAFYDKPFVKFERILETYLAVAPQGLRSFLMAIPLWLLKRQGATRAETAFLFVAADPAFIREWYLRELTNDGWTLITATPRRILFVKERSAVQITIDPQRDLLTPYQLVYLNGLTKRQLTDLRK